MKTLTEEQLRELLLEAWGHGYHTGRMQIPAALADPERQKKVEELVNEA